MNELKIISLQKTTMFILFNLMIMIAGMAVNNDRRLKAMVSTTNLLAEKVNNLEGRIDLHEGKATLIDAQLCILKEEALSDIDLALDLTRACVRAHNQKVKDALANQETD